MAEKKYKFEEVWKTLSAVNVNEHTDEKQGLTYLSWAWAWGIMMQYYPEFEFSFFETEDNLPYVSLPDGSAEVRCTVTIGNLSRTQSLPLSVGFKPILNPNAFQINTAKQRCLTKCFGIYGLGHYIYAGEDLPQDEVEQIESEDLELEEKPAKKEVVKQEPVEEKDEAWAETFVDGFLKVATDFCDTKESVKEHYKNHSDEVALLKQKFPTQKKRLDDLAKQLVENLEIKNISEEDK